MKFLHEMIAKKRQAQAEVQEQGPQSEPAQSYDLPEMSAVSPEAVPLEGAEPETASIIPYRQRAAEGEQDGGAVPAQIH